MTKSRDKALLNEGLLCRLSNRLLTDVLTVSDMLPSGTPQLCGVTRMLCGKSP